MTTKTSTTPQGWAVITGASSGLGAVFAERLAADGHPVLLAGRDRRRLDDVAQRIAERTPAVPIEVVSGDLATADGQDALIRHLSGRPIDILINNAGFGSYGTFDHADPDRESAIIDVNVQGLQRITRAVLPGMRERHRGGVLNVASTIAFQPAPFQAVYGASKAFVLTFSQALAGELRGTGVTVTAFCPGVTQTGFADSLQADVSHLPLYRRAAAPGPVVDAGLRALRQGRLVRVPGWRNKLLTLGSRFLPRGLLVQTSATMLRPAGPPQTMAPTET